MNIGLFDVGFYERSRKKTSVIIDDLVETVSLADTLGFNRYWLGEHYTPGAAWYNPLILISILTGITGKIKIGHGGLLIMLHNLIEVYENYNLLNYFFHNRIEIGIARGFAPDSILEQLNLTKDNLSLELYIEKALQLLNAFKADSKDLNGFPLPLPLSITPKFWILGSGTNSARFALHNRIPYVASLFHKAVDYDFQKKNIANYKQAYFDLHQEDPEVVIALSGIVATDTLEINRSKAVAKLLYADFKTNIVATPGTIQEQFMSIQNDFGIDNFLFIDLNSENQLRRQSLSIISDQLLKSSYNA